MATFVKDYLKNHNSNQLIRLIGSKIDKRYTVQIVAESESKFAHILYSEDTYDFYWVKLWINLDEIVVMSSVIATNDQPELNTYTFTYGSSIEQLIDFYNDQMLKVKNSSFKQKEYSVIKRKREMDKDFV